jgi:transposase
MKEVSIIGLDLAKNVFQVNGVGADEIPVVRRKLRRAEVLSFFAKLPAWLVGMEACGGSHYWAREIAALSGELKRLERGIVAAAKHDPDIWRLATIPGVGAITAASIKTLLPDIGGFKSARHFASCWYWAPWPCCGAPRTMRPVWTGSANF